MRIDSVIRTAKTLNFHLYDTDKTEGPYDMPTVERCDLTMDDLRGCTIAGFDKAKSFRGDRSNQILHFYLHDWFFDRLWNRPEVYIPLLKKYKAVIMPDFSIWTDMPRSLQLYNSFRCKLLAQYWQSQGITVIPSPHWALEDSFEFVFDGLPEGGLYAISTVGSDKEIFDKGFEEWLERKRPERILLFGQREYELNNTQILRVKRDNHKGKKGGFEWVIQEVQA